MAKIPSNFSGQKFMLKYSLTKNDFGDDGNGNLLCPSLPALTDAELLDCALTTNELLAFAQAALRLQNARVTAKAIPDWATWSQAEWQTYFDTNLSTTQVATVTTIAIARTMLNRQNLVIQNLVKLVLAMRDNQWPDL